MGPRLTIRSFVWGFCLTIALFGARSARAAAPICDETATSRIAPPPVLPIRDVKFEAGFPCDVSPVSEAPVTVAPIDPHAPASPVITYEAVVTEAWVRPIEVSVIAPMSGRSLVGADASVPAKPGFTACVFRPPRGE
jgi:hypothetical protein